MRKLLLLLLALPVIVLAQDKNVINFSRYFPKAEKATLFEKALSAHAQKYHTGDVKWQVYSIETGMYAGGYLVAEGPTNWDGVDNRGDISKAHMDDWNATVQPLVTERTVNDYFVYRQDLSTADLKEKANKIVINHLYQKPGYYGELQEILASLKKTWAEADQSVAVCEGSASGEPQFITISMYKQGELKDREVGARTPFPARFAKANGGESAWTKYIETYKLAVNRQWSEMLFYKPELGSK